MKRGKQTTSQAWAELLQRYSSGRPQPRTMLQWLALGQVRTHEAIFQHRRPPEHASAAHVRELRDKVNASPNKTLDPITVWWDGRDWVCLDGHHRIKAYRASGMDKHHDIPAEVFEGTPEAAIAYAAKANSRTKLQMGRQEKAAAAWRLVTTTNLSKEVSADCAGVSARLIALMRAARKTLEAKGVADLADMRWDEARRMAEGKAVGNEGWEPDAKEKMAQEWATAIGKALPPLAHNSPDVLAMALELFNAQMPGWLADHWQQEDEEDEPEE